MIREFEGIGQEDHWSLYELQDTWWKEARKLNPRSPKTGKILVSWNQVSASQIENYVKCPRAWFFSSVMRAPRPQTGSQALGSSYHLIMEKVPKGLAFPSREDTNATEEEWDKAVQMANQTLPLLPKDPGGLIKREYGIQMETYEGGPIFKGYIDLALPPGIGWPAFLIPANEAIIGDYKTTSDFRYMKTPEELASSIQMMSYAKWAITEGPGGLVNPAEGPLPEHVRLLHIYARTRGAINRSSIRESSAVVSAPQIEDFWGKTLDIVRVMQSTASCTNAEDVEAKGALNGHCEAYGGCQFRDKCGLEKSSGIKNLFQIGKKPASTPTSPTEETMSGSAVMQRILAARAAAQGTTPQATQANVEQGQASPTPAPEAAVSSSPVAVEATPGNSASTGVGAEAGNSSSASVSTPLAGSAVAATGISPVKGPISGLLAKIESTGHGKPVLTGSVAQQLNKETGQNLVTYPGEGMRAQTTIASIGELMKYASGIIPPDAPPRTQATITTPGMAVADPEAEPAASTEEGEDDESVSTPETTPASVHTAVAGSPVPATAASGNSAQASGQAPIGTIVQSGPSIPVAEKKRGRPSKEEIAQREAAEAAAFNAKVEAEVQKRLGLAVDGKSASQGNGSSDLLSQLSIQASELQGAREALARAEQTIKDLRAKSGSDNTGRSPSSEEGLTLYIDTMPTKGVEATDFYEWIRPATQAVEETNGVKDWRLINYTAKGLLATQIRELITLTGLPKALVIPSFAGGADIALEILSPLAKRVIRPLR